MRTTKRSLLKHGVAESTCDSPQFFLHGINGVYNYGCEAIIRGTLEIFRRAWPSARLVYLSRRPKEDIEALSDCCLEIEDVASRPLLDMPRLVRGALRRLGLPYEGIPFDSVARFGRSDCLISIGGDIFTLPPGPYPSHRRVKQLAFPKHVIRRGCSFVLWGASVGPFDQWPSAILSYKNALQSMALITVREPNTVRYLESLGINRNVVSVADPAFLMPADLRADDTPFIGNEIATIGVNLSPLSVRYSRVNGRDLDGVLKEQIVFLRKLIDTSSARILLIPHVVAPHTPQDDDFGYLQKIFTAIKETHGNRVALVAPNLGARRTKAVIGSCDFLIAARMHCGIAGVSMAVPTIFVSYSAKSIGMAEYVYGDNGWSVSLENLATNDTLEKLKEKLKESKETREFLRRKSSYFKESAINGALALKEVLKQGKESARRRYRFGPNSGGPESISETTKFPRGTTFSRDK